jgi:[ribosomal protein S5]-alanine N-acetyltransferase
MISEQSAKTRFDPSELVLLDRIEGQHTLLESFAVEDISAQYVAWLNDPEVVRYSNQRFITHTAHSCTLYVRNFKGSVSKLFKIIRKSDATTIGTITAHINQFHQTADLGILIGERSSWGKGLGGDAWFALLNALLSLRQIRKVTAGTMDCNQSMIRVIQKSGMKLEAVRSKQELLDGKPQDILYFAKFNEKSV